jgi:hypothetical protein
MLLHSTPTSRVAERRTALRYPLRLPVVFSWQDEAGRVQGCDGYSRDLGSRGIYVYAEFVPPLGVSVEMNVFLPRPEHSARPSEIHAIGRVVRSERPGSPTPQGNGFAAMNHTTLLRETRGRSDAPDSTPDSTFDEFGLGRTADRGDDASGK